MTLCVESSSGNRPIRKDERSALRSSGPGPVGPLRAIAANPPCKTRDANKGTTRTPRCLDVRQSSVPVISSHRRPSNRPSTNEPHPVRGKSLPAASYLATHPAPASWSEASSCPALRAAAAKHQYIRWEHHSSPSWKRCSALLKMTHSCSQLSGQPWARPF